MAKVLGRFEPDIIFQGQGRAADRLARGEFGVVVVGAECACH